MSANYKPIGKKHAKSKNWKLNIHKLLAMLIFPSAIVACLEINYYYFRPDWNPFIAIISGVTMWIVGFIICSWLDIK